MVRLPISSGLLGSGEREGCREEEGGVANGAIKVIQTCICCWSINAAKPTMEPRFLARISCLQCRYDTDRKANRDRSILHPEIHRGDVREP